VLYRQQGPDAPEVFLDPNTFSKDGTTKLASLSFSRDGSLVAYQVSESGSDWRKVCMRRTANKQLVGATMAQRPDLYQVAFPAVGVMDMLRYQRFTVGPAGLPTTARPRTRPRCSTTSISTRPTTP
jgi:prolyl oligopeptidase PreP (S9A serine peptidase family)